MFKKYSKNYNATVCDITLNIHVYSILYTNDYLNGFRINKSCFSHDGDIMY